MLETEFEYSPQVPTLICMGDGKFCRIGMEGQQCLLMPFPSHQIEMRDACIQASRPEVNQTMIGALVFLARRDGGHLAKYKMAAPLHHPPPPSASWGNVSARLARRVFHVELRGVRKGLCALLRAIDLKLRP